MASTFGEQLRHWRSRRGMSQLDLALFAHLSQNKVSALETGKADPDPELVDHLGEVLGIPLRERNVLLEAAGHEPVHHETPLDGLGVVGRTLDELLAAHEPNMAVIVDRHWNLVRSNPAGARFLFAMFPDPPEWVATGVNLVRLYLHPEGLRPHLVDWEATARALLRRLERDVAERPNDHDLEALLVEVGDYPDVADLLKPSAVPAPQVVHPPLIHTSFHVGGKDIRLFTTVATIRDAKDLTLEELRIETSFPADPESAKNWVEVVGLA